MVEPRLGMNTNYNQQIMKSHHLNDIYSTQYQNTVPCSGTKRMYAKENYETYASNQKEKAYLDSSSSQGQIFYNEKRSFLQNEEFFSPNLSKPISPNIEYQNYEPQGNFQKNQNFYEPNEQFWHENNKNFYENEKIYYTDEF